MKSKQQGEEETTMSPFHDSIAPENLAMVKLLKLLTLGSEKSPETYELHLNR